ncbi:LysR family transcriptional regulator [uncultured Aquitalea sp.]|uniref:LysR family transcriptional regulator n=1 Tax=uncultured Aquitalea sp. TaxID=540272 RepID=UPI0025D9441C|nr:LysR family transcriptional regulator [uncultured Aquitalea sp.]
MKLRHIEIFNAIMQAGSISAAAQSLHVSQPAASKALQQAERQLGFALFERHKGKLSPTHEALALFADVDELNQRLQVLRRKADMLRRGGAESLRVAATPALAGGVLPAAFKAWRSDFPAVFCELSTHHTRELVEGLLLGELDVGFGMRQPDHPGIEARPLAEGCLQVLAPAGYWEASVQRQPLDIAELDGVAMLGLPDDDRMGRLFALSCEQAGVAPQIRTRVQTYQLASRLTALGEGLAIADPFTVQDQGEGVAARELTPAIPVTVYALLARQHPPSEAESGLMQRLAEEALGRLRPHALDM